MLDVASFGHRHALLGKINVDEERGLFLHLGCRLLSLLLRDFGSFRHGCFLSSAFGILATRDVLAALNFRLGTRRLQRLLHHAVEVLALARRGCGLHAVTLVLDFGLDDISRRLRGSNRCLALGFGGGLCSSLGTTRVQHHIGLSHIAARARTGITSSRRLRLFGSEYRSGGQKRSCHQRRKQQGLGPRVPHCLSPTQHE